MKLNQKRIDSIFNKSQVFVPNISNKKQYKVFPFTIKSGFVDSTEKGFVYRGDINDYSRFERIFTGFDAILAIWDNSTSTEKRDGKLYKHFQQGSFYNMHYDSETISDDFSTTQSGTYLKEQIVTESVFYSKNRFTAQDVLKLYVILGKYGNELFYISNVEEYEHPETNDFIYCKVTFRTLNDKLADTGLAIDEFVQFSAPGEGYAYPEIGSTDIIDPIKDADALVLRYKTVADIPSNLIFNNEFYIDRFLNNNNVIVKQEYFGNNKSITAIKSINGVVLNQEKLANNPIRFIQLEIYGPGILSSVYAYGRTANNTGEITRPKMLMIGKMTQPNLNNRDIDKPYIANNDWYWIPRSRLEIESFYKNWIEKTQGNWNPSITKKWLGYLRIVVGDYKSSSKPALGWRIFSDILTLGIQEIAYSLADTEKPTGGYYELKGVQNLPKLLTRGYFVHRGCTRLPLTYKESVSWNFKDIPLVGGFFSKITLGLQIGWKNQKETGGKLYNVSGMIPSGILDFYKNTFIGIKSETLTSKQLGNDKQSYTAIPLDGLSDSKEPSSLSQSEFATVIAYELTDEFYTESADNNNYGNLKTDGSIDHDKFPTQPTSDLHSSGITKTTDNLGYVTGGVTNKINVDNFMPREMENKDKGFTIDSFGFNFIGQAEYKMIMYDKNGNVQFTGTYNTLSKLTGSPRDWTNTIKLSNWESDSIVDTGAYDNTQIIPILPNELANNGYNPGILKNLLAEEQVDGKNVIRYDGNGKPIDSINEFGEEIISNDEYLLSKYSLGIEQPTSFLYSNFGNQNIRLQNEEFTLEDTNFIADTGIKYYNLGYRTGILKLRYREYWAKDAGGGKFEKWNDLEINIKLNSNGIVELNDKEYKQIKHLYREHSVFDTYDSILSEFMYFNDSIEGLTFYAHVRIIYNWAGQHGPNTEKYDFIEFNVESIAFSK